MNSSVCVYLHTCTGTVADVRIISVTVFVARCCVLFHSVSLCRFFTLILKTVGEGH